MHTGPVPVRRSSRTAVWIAAIVAAALLSGLFGSLLTYWALAPAPIDPGPPGAPVVNQPAEDDPHYQHFLKVFKLVQEEFVAEVDTEQLWEAATAGIVRGTADPYSSYMDTSQFRELLEHASGSYVGIGVVLTEMNDYTVVISPFEGTPADRAGLKPGDKIVEVNGRDVVGTPLDAVVSLIRGPAGTSVELTIVRDQEVLAMDLIRDVINIPSVTAELLEDGIGYIRISQFTSQTAADLEPELRRLEADGMRGLVLDLRNNPGGDLDVCIRTAELFVPDGPIVHLVDRQGVETTYSGDGPGVDYPVAVLINGGSASSAEILAAAIRDRGVGRLFGVTTFGKASVQTIYPLAEGLGLKLTTARYLTPNRQSIDSTGLEPDVEVEALEDADAQLESAKQYVQAELEDDK